MTLMTDITLLGWQPTHVCNPPHPCRHHGTSPACDFWLSVYLVVSLHSLCLSLCWVVCWSTFSAWEVQRALQGDLCSRSPLVSGVVRYGRVECRNCVLRNGTIYVIRLCLTIAITPPVLLLQPLHSTASLIALSAAPPLCCSLLVGPRHPKRHDYSIAIRLPPRKGSV